MAKTIFYSWQSDLPNNTNRSFIQNCINDAIKKMKNEFCICIDFICDRDTKNMPGSPDIAQTIFYKIDLAEFFICDVSIISSMNARKKSPNPNVLIELGYAIKTLGWEKILCVFNTQYGKIEDLPFDLRHQRILPYSFDENTKSQEKTKIAHIIVDNIKTLYSKGMFYNPLNDYMKGKIDQCFISVGGNIANVLFGSHSMSDGLTGFQRLLEMTDAEIKTHISTTEIMGFFLYNNYETSRSLLENQFNKIISSSFFPREWATVTLQFIEWINENSYFISERNVPLIMKKINNGENCIYKYISAHKMNTSNPPDSYILLLPVEDGTGGKVINTSEFIHAYKENALVLYKFNENQYKNIFSHIDYFLELCHRWLKLTDNEFILSKDKFRIKPKNEIFTSIHKV